MSQTEGHRKVYVIDTETTTTSFAPVPNGHVVEIGVAEVDLYEGSVTPFYESILTVTKMVKGRKKIDPNAWVFQNTDLTVEQVENGKDPRETSQHLASLLRDKEATAFNQRFDRIMLERDLPELCGAVRWGQDLMECADVIEEIPRARKRSCYPNAENTYNHLCRGDPACINGKEEHRALSDAMMEGHILLELHRRGLYTPLPTIVPACDSTVQDRDRLDRIHELMDESADLIATGRM